MRRMVVWAATRGYWAGVPATSAQFRLPKTLTSTDEGMSSRPLRLPTEQQVLDHAKAREGILSRPKGGTLVILRLVRVPLPDCLMSCTSYARLEHSAFRKVFVSLRKLGMHRPFLPRDPRRIVSPDSLHLALDGPQPAWRRDVPLDVRSKRRPDQAAYDASYEFNSIPQPFRSGRADL
jgi:hypothetical protein